MTKYSDNLTVADVDAVLRALPDHEITGDEIAMIISEIALRFCGTTLEALLIIEQAAWFTAAEAANQDGRVIQ